MKQQDIAIIIIIVFFAGIFSFVISNKFITPSTDKRTAETVSAIEPTFIPPSAQVFNSSAINPTVQIQIAPGNNGQPFDNEDN